MEVLIGLIVFGVGAVSYIYFSNNKKSEQGRTSDSGHNRATVERKLADGQAVDVDIQVGKAPFIIRVQRDPWGSGTTMTFIMIANRVDDKILLFDDNDKIDEFHIGLAYFGSSHHLTVGTYQKDIKIVPGDVLEIMFGTIENVYQFKIIEKGSRHDKDQYGVQIDTRIAIERSAVEKFTSEAPTHWRYQSGELTLAQGTFTRDQKGSTFRSMAQAYLSTFDRFLN